MDPELRRNLDNLREMVKLRHQNPTHEWPLVFVDEMNELLVVREWPGGQITSYTMRRQTDDTAQDD